VGAGSQGAAEAARRAAADALRARANELRRAPEPSATRTEERAPDGAGEPHEAPVVDAIAPPHANAGADAERARLESELETLRGALEVERRNAEEKLQTVVARARAEEAAAEELRRLAEAEARQRMEEETRRREGEEESLRAAIESARVEMERLRRKSEEEARRRAEAEAEVRRLAEEAARRPVPPAAFDFPAEETPDAAPPDPDPLLEVDPAEQIARMRVAALRSGAKATRPSAAPDPARAAMGAAWLDGDLDSADAPAGPLAPPPELRSGTSSELSTPRLLALAARARMGGRLDFRGEGARSIYFEEGRVVGATSADPGERLEELALRLGLVTRDQHRQVAQVAGTLPTRRAALFLVERGFLKPTELTALVRRRTEEVLFGLFSDAAARFRWVAEEVPPEERVALERGALALAVEGVRRRWLAARVDEVLGTAGTLLAPSPQAPPAADLGLAPEERRIVGLADGLRTVDEILAASPLDALTTRQVLAALVEVGALSVRTFEAARPAGATAAIDLARVEDKLDQVRRADYFQVLGIGRRCTPHEVREAAARLTAEFAPGRFAESAVDGLEERLQEILRVVEDARAVLADDRLRQEYLNGLGG
jgi:hypothetical protein